MTEVNSIESADWNDYETTVLEALSGAVAKYNSEFGVYPDEKVSQISIWTDPQSLTSAINFETQASARRHRDHRIEQNRRRGFVDAVASLQAQQYNGSVADFRHAQYVEFSHPELGELSGYVVDNETETAMLVTIEKALIRVVSRVLDSGLLSRLHAEESVWIGVNSSEDWYDDVIEVKLGAPT